MVAKVKKPKLHTLKYYDFCEVIKYLKFKGWESDDRELLISMGAHNNSYMNYEVGRNDDDMYLEFDRALVNELGLKLGQRLAFWVCW